MISAKAKNSKKILSKGEKLNIVIAKKLFEKGLTNISVSKFLDQFYKCTIIWVDPFKLDALRFINQ